MRAIVAAMALVALAAVIYALLPSHAPPPALRGKAAPERPAPPAGSPLEFSLGEPPARTYGRPNPTPSEDLPVVRALGLEPDATLAQAARELARQYAVHRALLPGDALQFVLDSAGATFWSVRQTVVVTRDPSPRGVAEALSDQLEEDGPDWRGGVGRVALPAEDDDHTVVAVLSARPTVTLAPLDRAPPADEAVYVRGALAEGYRDPHALAMTPQGRFVDLPVEQRGGRFEVVFTPDAGLWVLELLAEGPHGPTPVAQLSFEVGGAAPEAFLGRWPTKPRGRGADVVRALVAADRAAHGQPPLTVDPTLTAVAEAHTGDMMKSGFLGHVSPTTGRPADRVRAADYRAAIVAENVAFNRSLTDAQAGLMRSLGHRRNLLNDQVTHLGVAARKGADGWYLTQVFARPRPVVHDATAAAAQLRARLAAQLDRRIEHSQQLDRLARAEAQRADPKPNRVLDAVAAEGVTGRVTAWVATLALLEQFDPPEAVHDERFDRVGIGVHQVQRDSGPDIQVVMLLAE